MIDQDSVPPCLHDCLALGAVAAGLQNMPTTTTTTASHQPHNDSEIHRLPLLLRLLSQSRPLSGVPVVLFPVDHNNHTEHPPQPPQPPQPPPPPPPPPPPVDEPMDSVIEEAVARLEDRAALYSAAEGVHMVACHLAPAVSRRLSRLPPLKRRKAVPYSYFDTTALAVLAADPFASTAASPTALSGHKKSRRSSWSAAVASATGNEGEPHPPPQHRTDILAVDASYHSSNADDDDDNDPDDKDMADHPKIKKRRRRKQSASSSADRAFANASQDSQEYLVLKTLQELAHLTVLSLKNDSSLVDVSRDGTSNNSTPTATATTTAHSSSHLSSSSSSLSIMMDDSILAEAARPSESSVGGAMVSGDLGSTVVSLLHYASVLRHDHVASALCRAAVPQAPALIARMGANCPAAVPTLLVGCVHVYQQVAFLRSATGTSSSSSSSSSSSISPIAAVCVKAVRELANLSPREGHRALALLRRRQQDDGRDGCCCMVELQLELAIKLQDPLSAACLIIEHLSQSSEPIEHLSQSSEPQNVTSTVAEVATPVLVARRKSLVSEQADEYSPEQALDQSSLQVFLDKDPDLVARTVQFLCDELSFDDEALKMGMVPWGKVCIVLTAYIRLFKQVLMTDRWIESASQHRGLEKLSAGLEVLRSLLKSLQKQTVGANSASPTMTAERPIDRTYCLVAVALVSTVAVLVSTQDFALTDRIEAKALELLKQVLTVRSDMWSHRTQVILIRIALAMKYTDPRSICAAIESTLVLCPRESSPLDSACDGHFARRLTKLCEWALSKEIIGSSLLTEHLHNGVGVMLDPSISLQLMSCNQISDSVKTASMKKLLNRVLTEKHAAFLFLRHPLASVFIDIASSFLLASPGPKLPLVLPVQIEGLFSTFRLRETGAPGPHASLFLVRLLYCFSFFEHEPNSSFKFDPRALPLKQIYVFCKSPSMKRLNEHVVLRLKNYIDRFCAEVRRWEQYLTLQSRNVRLRTGSFVLPREGTKLELMKVLRKSVAEPHADPCGLAAEKAFVAASSYLTDADLCSVSASALVSRPFSPPLFFTYSMLYRDPLTIMKCPLSVWSRRGTRRIALTVLSSLLDTNDEIVSKNAASYDVPEEFLCCRDELVVRSLISAATSSLKLDGSDYQCGMTSGIVRKLVARHQGLVALLIKQGVTEIEVDWMIESVPEVIEDVSALRDVLTSRNSLTAVERLVAADGILRIAIAHGHRYNGEAEALAYAALSQLLASFFLIVGPVGIPVNTLVGDGNGLDATQVSRKAAFRMLNALQKVRGYRVRLKTECVISLQKFAGMCKGESIVGSSPPVTAGRQKALLKELLDSVGRASDAMGSGLLV